MVTLTINGKQVSVKEGTTILQASLQLGIEIPTLCYLKDINEIGACRVCVVEIVGKDRLVTACNTLCEEGMQVLTDSEKAITARKTNVKLLLSQHDFNCLECVRGDNCKLQALVKALDIQENEFPLNLVKDNFPKDFPLVRDTNKCIKCMRCIQVCDKIQALGVWDTVGAGARVNVGVKCGDIKKSDCSLCGQCITHCPVGALRERDDTDKLLEAINDKDKITVVQIAPAVRTAYGEDLHLQKDLATVKRLVASVKALGVSYVFDTDFSADLTIMEEANEFLTRLPDIKNSGIAMFTSCCPAWVRYLKAKYPLLIGNLSTAKSPQQMFGAIAKTYYAKILNVSPEKIYCVSIMPCVSKKQERALDTMKTDGVCDVDLTLTTRELARLIKNKGIDVASLKEQEFDSPLGVGTGAGAIFGTTGGVMEAALRTAYYLKTGNNPSPDAFKEVGSNKGYKEATFSLDGLTLNVAVVNGLKNAETLIENMLSGKAQYDFVEVMACPGGCVGGGGQPIHPDQELQEERSKVLRDIDKNSKLRFSHENPAVIACYKDFLQKPLSNVSHKLLHTDHSAWKMPNEEEE